MERHIVYNYSGFKKSPRQVYRNPHLNDGAPLQVKISSARWSQRGWITSAIVHGTATPTPAWRRISPKGAIPPGPRSHMCWSLALKNCLLLAGGCFKATLHRHVVLLGLGWYLPQAASLLRNLLQQGADFVFWMDADSLFLWLHFCSPMFCLQKKTSWDVLLSAATWTS